VTAPAPPRATIGLRGPAGFCMADERTDETAAAARASTYPDDAALVAALRAGEAAAFEQVVRTHGGKLLATARRILRDDDEARDALQEGFLAAFRGIGSFAGEAKLSTWLHRVVVNAALMRRRSRQRRQEESIDELLPTFLDDGHHATPSSYWNAPVETVLARREDRARVRACIDQLPDTYRNVLLLRDIEELDTEETAQVLGVSPNAVKIRLHRARQALRTLLDPHFRGGAA